MNQITCDFSQWLYLGLFGFIVVFHRMQISKSGHFWISAIHITHFTQHMWSSRHQLDAVYITIFALCALLNSQRLIWDMRNILMLTRLFQVGTNHLIINLQQVASCSAMAPGSFHSPDWELFVLDSRSWWCVCVTYHSKWGHRWENKFFLNILIPCICDGAVSLDHWQKDLQHWERKRWDSLWGYELGLSYWYASQYKPS